MQKKEVGHASKQVFLLIIRKHVSPIPESQTLTINPISAFDDKQGIPSPLRNRVEAASDFEAKKT
jgi:hypothetical protein